jgi:hypothetical protein
MPQIQVRTTSDKIHGVFGGTLTEHKNPNLPACHFGNGAHFLKCLMSFFFPIKIYELNFYVV